MTRQEEIEKAANEIYAPLHPAWSGNENQAFQSGALWADANPIEPILELIHQRSIAFDEARDAREKLKIATEALEEICRASNSGCFDIASKALENSDV